MQQSVAPRDLAATLASFKTLGGAGECVTNFLDADRKQFPELWNWLHLPAAGDYVEEDNFFRKSTYVLPEEFVQQESYFNCLTGLFPEINRAWISFDNRIFLWNFSNENGCDYFCYDQLDQIIISAGIVRPRRDVFVDEIQYLLILATPLEVHIIGIHFANGIFGEMTLHNTQLSVPSDNVNMLKICGTEDGRVFMCGGDGHLYELLYDSEDGWFNKKCRKRNHTQHTLTAFVPSFLMLLSQDDPIVDCVYDASRRIMYCLTEHSAIQVFDLEGGSLKHVVTQNRLGQDVGMHVRGIDDQTFKIVSIHVVPSSESAQIHLVAVTSDGHRLYLSTSMSFYSVGAGHREPPDRLELKNVRTGPKVRLRTGSSLYADGIMLFAGAKSQDDDEVYAISPDVTSLVHKIPRRPTFGMSGQPMHTGPPTADKMEASLMESYAAVAGINGRVNAMAEVPLSVLLRGGSVDGQKVIQEMAGSMAHGDPPTLRNELGIQHILPARRFLCFSGTGVHVLVKLRPIDVLIQLLRREDSDKIQSFFAQYGDSEACAMCLALAASRPEDLRRTMADDLPAPPPSEVFSSTRQGALGAAATYRESFAQGRMSSPAVLRDANVVHNAKRLFFKMGGAPQYNPAPQVDDGGHGGVGYALPQPEVIHSGMHDGLYLFMSRLLRHVWEHPITEVREAVSRPGAPPEVQHMSRLTKAELRELGDALRRLGDFLEKEPNFIAPPSQPFGNSTAMRYTGPINVQHEKEAQRREQQSLHALTFLLRRCTEAVEFLLILEDHHLDRLIAGMPEGGPNGVTRDELQRLNFRDLVSTERGAHISRCLANHLIITKISQDTHITDMSERMRKKCPDYFSELDMLRYAGFEKLHKAELAGGEEERDILLRESLDLFCQSAVTVALGDVAERYAYLRFYVGVLQLSLSCAKAIDPDPGLTNEELYGKRNECYDVCIAYGLKELIDPIVGQGQGMGMGDIPADPLVPRRVRPPMDAASQERTRGIFLRRAMDSSDVDFHYALFQWFYDNNKTRELLDLKSPYLRDFLTGDPKFSDFLWQYYVRNKQYLRAAGVLKQLAEGRWDGEVEGRNADLKGRIECLSLAIANAKSAARPTGDTPLAREVDVGELETKLEIAHIQHKILTAMLKRKNTLNAPDDALEEALAELNKGLIPLKELYKRYAAPFKLCEECLAIVHCAEYKDTALVERLWRSIIAEEPTMASLLERLTRLGRLYSDSEEAWPLDFLVKTLENKHLEERQYGSSPKFGVLTMLRDVNIAWHDLFDVYNRLLDSETRTEAKVHYLSVLHNLLYHWKREALAPNAPMKARHIFHARRPLVQLEKYMAELTAHSGEEAENTRRQFNELRE